MRNPNVQRLSATSRPTHQLYILLAALSTGHPSFHMSFFLVHFPPQLIGLPIEEWVQMTISGSGEITNGGLF
jgi:hypothetical protein